MIGEPAGALRHAQPNPPDENRADAADQHNPAPAFEAKGRNRHQPPGKKGHNRNDRKLHRLVYGKDPAAMRSGHQLGEVGVDCHQFDPDADAGNKSPHIQAKGIGLKRHDGTCRSVPEQRARKDCTTAEPVCNKTKHQCANEQPGEQRGDETGDSCCAEKPRCCGGQNPAVYQTGRDEAGEHQVVKFEEPAQRKQDDANPEGPRHRQPVEPGCNQSGRVIFRQATSATMLRNS